MASLHGINEIVIWPGIGADKAQIGQVIDSWSPLGIVGLLGDYQQKSRPAQNEFALLVTQPICNISCQLPMIGSEPIQVSCGLAPTPIYDPTNSLVVIRDDWLTQCLIWGLDFALNRVYCQIGWLGIEWNFYSEWQAKDGILSYGKYRINCNEPQAMRIGTWSHSLSIPMA